jgi:hypothetical protein
MGQSSAVKNWATHYGLGVKILDAETAPANDTTITTAAEIPRFKWIHLANEGLYEGHHQGPFTLTRQVFESFVKNLRDHPQYRAGSLQLTDGKTYTGGVEPVIQFDYEHASECPPWEGTIPQSGAPACAWVLDVAIRNAADGKAQLWAFADLGDELRTQIRLRKQRWVSIAFALESVHWITKAPLGPMLTSVAITNHPFMLDLEPLAAANRPTSQGGRSAVRSASDSSEAPDDRQPTRTGAHMDEKLRERVCKALKIRLAADDGEVGAAVEEAVTGNNNLTTVLEALGVPLTGEALKVIPQLRAAEQKIQGVLQELRDLLTQEQVADAAVAQSDVGAAMKAGNLSGDGASKAMVAYRAHIINEEVKKLGDGAKVDGEPKLSKLREARKAGREKFLGEYGVKDLALSHLSTPVVSGAGGTQLEPPKPGGKVIPIDQTVSSADGETVIDLRGVPGPNPTLQLVAHLSKTDPAFAKLPHHKQVQKASEYRKTVTLQLA